MSVFCAFIDLSMSNGSNHGGDMFTFHKSLHRLTKTSWDVLHSHPFQFYSFFFTLYNLSTFENYRKSVVFIQTLNLWAFRFRNDYHRKQYF